VNNARTRGTRWSGRCLKRGLQIPLGHPITGAVLRTKTTETYCGTVFMKLTSVGRSEVKLKGQDPSQKRGGGLTLKLIKNRLYRRGKEYVYV